MEEFIKFLESKGCYIGRFNREFGFDPEFESLTDKELNDLIKEFETRK